MKKQKYIWNILLILVLTLGALWFALKDNYQIVLSSIQKMNPAFFLLICVWGALYTAVWGLVYYVFGKKYLPDYTPIKGIIVAFVGSFFAGVTPSSTGGQFGQAYIMKKQGIRVSDSVSLLWADFIIYQTTMMIIVTILFLLKYGYYSAQSAWFKIILLGYIINAVVISVLYTVALFPKAYVKLTNALANWISKLKFIKNGDKMVESWTLQMASFTSEARALSKDKKRIAICVLINTVRLALLYSLPFAIARSLHINIDNSMLLDVMALSSFVLMANSFIPIPGASGGTEVVFMLLFDRLMYPLTGAVMVLWRFSTYHLIVLVGGILFAILRNYYDRKNSIDIYEEDL